MPRILIFGASITHGSWDKKGGWAQRLNEFLDSKKDLTNSRFFYLVYNLGISGNTTTDLLKRFKFETEKRIKKKETIIIFGIGGNDSIFLKSKNHNVTPPLKFKKNIEKLISLTKPLTKKIIFIGLTPVEESKTNPLPWNQDQYFQNKHLKKYNQIIKLICQKNNIYFVEIFEKLIKANYQKLLSQDGLHPNSQGHQKIFKLLKTFLIKKKII